MKATIIVVGITLVISTFASTLYADPPHGKRLPPGLQKKYERGGALPPGWKKNSPGYRYDHDYDYGYDYEYGYEEPNYDQYEPDYVEDKVYRIIKNVRDLSTSFN